jgi:hypothetical protein
MRKVCHKRVCVCHSKVGFSIWITTTIITLLLPKILLSVIEDEQNLGATMMGTGLLIELKARCETARHSYGATLALIVYYFLACPFSH